MSKRKDDKIHKYLRLCKKCDKYYRTCSKWSKGCNTCNKLRSNKHHNNYMGCYRKKLNNWILELESTFIVIKDELHLKVLNEVKYIKSITEITKLENEIKLKLSNTEEINNDIDLRYLDYKLRILNMKKENLSQNVI